MKIDLSSISEPQLKAMRVILKSGVDATSEKLVDDTTVLESESTNNDEGDNMEEKVTALEVELRNAKTAKAELETSIEGYKTSVTEKDEAIASLTSEKEALTTEVEGLRTFKETTDAATAKADMIKTRKGLIKEAGLDIDIEDEAKAEAWLSMSDDTFKFTVAELAAMKPVEEVTETEEETVAEALSAEAAIKVPSVKPIETTEDLSNVETVRAGFKNRK